MDKAKKILRAHWSLFGGFVMAIIYWFIEAVLHFTIIHRGTLSSELLPIDDANELWMRLFIAAMFVVFGIATDLILARLRRAYKERGRLVEQLKSHTNDLSERVKELGCLYGIDDLARRKGSAIEQVLEETVMLIPPSWQYPEITEGRITYEGKEFATKTFKKTEWGQTADIIIDRIPAGIIEVYYTKAMPEKYEGPFLEEERNLIDSMANRLSQIIQQKRTEKVLQEERWRLQSILNGTNVGTWEWNVETGKTVFNERWAEIIGYTLDEISPVSIETWMEFANPDDLKESGQLLERHFKGDLEYYEIECRMKHKAGYWVWVFDRGKVFSWTDEGKPLMMFGTHQDITERKQAELALHKSEERFQQLAIRDALTGLLNRRGWNESIADEEARAQRHGHQYSVSILDLDGLKEINDEYGHAAGDELIRRAAHCLRETVRNVDKIARIGGDEFAVLGIEYTAEATDKLLKRLEDALSAEGVRASWGAAISNPNSGMKDAIAEADRLMYEMKAKRQSKRST